VVVDVVVVLVAEEVVIVGEGALLLVGLEGLLQPYLL